MYCLYGMGKSNIVILNNNKKISTILCIYQCNYVNFVYSSMLCNYV